MCLLEVFDARPDEALRRRDDARLLLDGQVGDIAVAVAVDDEADRLQPAAVVATHLEQFRDVGLVQHLTPPQEVELPGGEAAVDPEHLARAAAAAVESQDQPGLLWGAAADFSAEAETAVVAVDAPEPLLLDLHHGIPDQRAVGEHPGIRFRVVRHQVAARGKQLLVGHERGVLTVALPDHPLDGAGGEGLAGEHGASGHHCPPSRMRYSRCGKGISMPALSSAGLSCRIRSQLSSKKSSYWACSLSRTVMALSP